MHFTALRFIPERVPYRFFEDDESNILNFKRVFDGQSRQPLAVAKELLLKAGQMFKFALPY